MHFFGISVQYLKVKFRFMKLIILPIKSSEKTGMLILNIYFCELEIKV